MYPRTYFMAVLLTVIGMQALVVDAVASECPVIPAGTVIDDFSVASTATVQDSVGYTFNTISLPGSAFGDRREQIATCTSGCITVPLRAITMQSGGGEIDIKLDPSVVGYSILQYDGADETEFAAPGISATDLTYDGVSGSDEVYNGVSVNVKSADHTYRIKLTVWGSDLSTYIFFSAIQPDDETATYPRDVFLPFNDYTVPKIATAVEIKIIPDGQLDMTLDDITVTCKSCFESVAMTESEIVVHLPLYTQLPISIITLDGQFAPYGHTLVFSEETSPDPQHYYFLTANPVSNPFIGLTGAFSLNGDWKSRTDDRTVETRFLRVDLTEEPAGPFYESVDVTVMMLLYSDHDTVNIDMAEVRIYDISGTQLGASKIAQAGVCPKYSVGPPLFHRYVCETVIRFEGGGVDYTGNDKIAYFEVDWSFTSSILLPLSTSELIGVSNFDYDSTVFCPPPSSCTTPILTTVGAIFLHEDPLVPDTSELELTFNVYLESAPTGDVVFDIVASSVAGSAITALPASLTLTTGNYASTSAHTVTVTLTRDAGDQGNPTDSGQVTITYNSATSTDMSYIMDPCESVVSVTMNIVDGDPHFSSLSEGGTYLVAGSQQRLPIYSIITTSILQYNARWITYRDHPTGHTQVTLENYFLIRRGATERRVVIAPSLNARLGKRIGQLRIMVDGVAFGGRVGESQELFPAVVGKSAVVVTRSSKLITILETDDFFFITTLVHNTRYMKARFGRHRHQPNKWPFLNTEIVVKDKHKLPHMRIHGLLGQTARAPVRTPTPEEAKRRSCQECYVEGKVEDYELDKNDMFGRSFKFNLYPPSHVFSSK